MTGALAAGTDLRSPRRAQLCFDDGPGELTEDVLGILAGAGITATFAIVGERALERPQTVLRIARDGHTIANHTMTHARLTDLTEPEVVEEIDRCTFALRGIGVEPTALRPPYAASSPTVERVAGERGLLLLAASSVGDYLYDDPDQLAHHVRSYTAFVGLHDTHPATIEALPAILEHLAA